MYSPRPMMRKMTESSNKSSRKLIDIPQMASGIRLIISDNVIQQGSLDQYREQINRYLKYEESFSKLRPVDIKMVYEYLLFACLSLDEITTVSTKKEIVLNVLLHIFFYRNDKFIRQAYNIKNKTDDQKEFNRLITFHKGDLNSQEMIKLIQWFKDYLNHYDLLFFKADSGSGLDIVHNVIIDVPTYVPPLAQANFIPQNIRAQTDYDSEEEEKYAKRQLPQTQVRNETEEHQEDNAIQPIPKDEIEEYITAQIQGASSQLFRTIDDRNTKLLEGLEAKKGKK